MDDESRWRYPSRFIESHEFPSGLIIDWESNPDEEYRVECNAVVTDEDLFELREWWRYLFPEVADVNTRAEILRSLLASEEMQKDYVDKANAGDVLAVAYLNLLLPCSLIKPLVFAKEYGVPTGTVFLQMWNTGMFVEHPDGTWVAKSWDELHQNEVRQEAYLLWEQAGRRMDDDPNYYWQLARHKLQKAEL